MSFLVGKKFDPGVVQQAFLTGYNSGAQDDRQKREQEALDHRQAVQLDAQAAVNDADNASQKAIADSKNQVERERMRADALGKSLGVVTGATTNLLNNHAFTDSANTEMLRGTLNQATTAYQMLGAGLQPSIPQIPAIAPTSAFLTKQTNESNLSGYQVANVIDQIRERQEGGKTSIAPTEQQFDTFTKHQSSVARYLEGDRQWRSAAEGLGLQKDASGDFIYDAAAMALPDGTPKPEYRAFLDAAKTRQTGLTEIATSWPEVVGRIKESQGVLPFAQEAYAKIVTDLQITPEQELTPGARNAVAKEALKRAQGEGGEGYRNLLNKIGALTW